jgi:hypothetical protein
MGANARRAHARAAPKSYRAVGGSSDSRDKPNADSTARLDGRAWRRTLCAYSLKAKKCGAM